MAASRDIPTHRPVSQHRQALGLVASSLPSRQSFMRTHSHSVSSGNVNPNNRVNRRKSSIQVNQTNTTVLAAMMKDGPPSTPANNGRGHTDIVGHAQSPKVGNASVAVGDTLIDGPPLSSMLASGKLASKSRTRRASEGSRVNKERSRSTAGELRCETCGKGYKHGSCLTKHLWEHTPEWALTSKLLISKHQQVQLLEAASVLVQMNQDGTPKLLHSSQLDDEHSSASPAASGSSDPIDEDDTSSRTSTPSQDESSSKPTRYHRRDRLDSFAEPFATSYQSSSAYGLSVPRDSHNVPMYRQWSSSYRSTNNGEYSDDEPVDVSKSAHGLTNASFRSPKSGQVQMQAGIPPVPPVPAKFRPDPVDVEMADDDNDNDDDDEGIFGHMEQ